MDGFRGSVVLFVALCIGVGGGHRQKSFVHNTVPNMTQNSMRWVLQSDKEKL